MASAPGPFLDVPRRIGIDARNLSDGSVTGSYIESLIGALAASDPGDREYLLLVSSADQHATADLPDHFHTVVEPRPLYSLREQAALSWRLLRLKLDLYHATHYLLPPVLPCRSVVTVYDVVDVLYPRFLPTPASFYFAQRQLRRSLARADRLIADSRNTKTDLINYLELDGRRIRVVYPGVAQAYHRALDEAEIDAVLERLGIARPYLLLVEDGDGPSNLDLVVAAFCEAAEEWPFAGSLVCCGRRTPLDRKVRQRAAAMGVADRLLLLEPLAEADRPAAFQGAELFLYPALHERAAPTVADALASGTAVVASSTAALREIAEGHAVLVDPLDRHEVAVAIAECMGDPERRRELARLARRRAADFTWQQTAAKTLEVYDSALRQRAWRQGKRHRQASG